MALAELQEPPELTEAMEPLALLGLLELRERAGLRVQVEPMALLVHRERMEVQVLLG